MFARSVLALLCKLYRGWVGGGTRCRGWVEVHYIGGGWVDVHGVGGGWVEGVLFAPVTLDTLRAYGHDCSEILIFSSMG